MLNQPGPDKDHKNIIEQGFTLVELLIVIVILGILAGVVIFAIGNLQNSAQAKSCSTEASTINTAIQSWKTANPTKSIGGTAAGQPSQQSVMADLFSLTASQTAIHGVTAAPNGSLSQVIQSVPKDYNSNGTGFWDWNKALTYSSSDTNQSWYIDVSSSTSPTYLKVVTGQACQ